MPFSGNFNFLLFEKFFRLCGQEASGRPFAALALCAVSHLAPLPGTLHGPSKNAGPWIASSAILVPLRF